MDFNEDFEEDFEPVKMPENNETPIIDTPEEDLDDTLMEFSPISENLTPKTNELEFIDFGKLNEIEEVKPIEEIVPINEIAVEPETKEELENVPVEDIETTIFSNELNKLKTEQEILNMNPELKDTKKIKQSMFQKYAVLLPIFAFFSTLFLGVYLFVSKTNAEEINLIKIEENNKVGYIDNEGNTIVRPKYLSGTNFYKGYAIVKNHNSLSAVINGKADLEVAFGNYFYIERFNNRYIVSKFTNEGLKLALVDSNLKEITKYKYDNISYAKNNTFLFTRDETMGVLNSEGKEIYTYMVDEVDDKNVTIEVSDTDNNQDEYAKIKVNNSSTIINLSTGKKVYKYTLDDIYVLDNNVFYIKSKNPDEVNNKYIVINNDDVVLETQKYKKVRVEDINSNIAIGINEDATYEYINLKNKKKINSNENVDYYYGDGLILSKTHNFNTNDDEYTIKDSNKTTGEFKNLKPINNVFKNDMLRVYVSNNKYNFVTKEGKLLNKEKYDFVEDFDDFGYAIVSKNNLYGVINKTGKEVVPIKYQKIELFDEDMFKTMKNKYKKDLFVYYENGKCGIINSKGDIVIKAIYDSFKYVTTEYPIIIGKFDSDKIIINIDSEKEFNIEVDGSVSVYDNYILVDKKYYNYNGKLIYNTKQEG